MPSSRCGVTFWFRYTRVWLPCGLGCVGSSCRCCCCCCCCAFGVVPPGGRGEPVRAILLLFEALAAAAGAAVGGGVEVLAIGGVALPGVSTAAVAVGRDAPAVVAGGSASGVA